MNTKNNILIDAGVEHILVRHIAGSGYKDQLIPNNDRVDRLFERYGVDKIISNPDNDVFLTGKTAETIRKMFGKGQVIITAAALWSSAKRLLAKGESSGLDSLGIIDLSASGYMVVAVGKNGQLKNDLLITNPKCGAGTGINFNRILEKLNIEHEEVDQILAEYLGEENYEKREKVVVRSDRCGVFSSSATISDKNQGIPISHALAVTMKSEVLKACKKMLPKIDRVYLTGRVFKWRYMRECTEDYLKQQGVRQVVYDENNTLLVEGMEWLIKTLGKENIKKQEAENFFREPELINLPSFEKIKDKYTADGKYKRIDDDEIDYQTQQDGNTAINIGLDIGSTMAKIVVTDALSGKIMRCGSYNNKGDTIQIVKHIFGDVKKWYGDKLNVEHIGITGSGRYQVQKLLRSLYPEWQDKIFVLVENYAHAYGAIEYAKKHVEKLKNSGKRVNENFFVIVDIGGEDTKVSVVSLKNNELYDNVMNVKCSAGTGSLMDTLKSLFNIEDINEACQKAVGASKAYEINATCAVFLMENAKNMQAAGFEQDEILASCNYAIVENMARTLWNQIELPKNAVVMLHGQTMLSDPLPLAVTHRIQKISNMYCLVPPLPGHRACIGLLNSISTPFNPPFVRGETTPLQPSPPRTGKEARSPLLTKEGGQGGGFLSPDKLIDVEFNKKMFFCHGVACGDKNSCCARTMLTTKGLEQKLTFMLGGCTAINDLHRGKNELKNTPNTYKEIWEMIDGRQPKSESPKRLVIPRSFSVSEQAYFLANIFEGLGIPVCVDNVKESDILLAQPELEIDVCAPLIGAIGQFTRLASEIHGIILAPQIDFLSTNNTSLGKTCTTNQGGIAIAQHYAKIKYPHANFKLVDLNLGDNDPDNLACQLINQLKEVWIYYDIEINIEKIRNAIHAALEKDRQLKNDIQKKVAGYLQLALDKKMNVSLVCGREYLLNPGIYDSHVGKLLYDKGVVAIPSYALDTCLDKDFDYIYWRNPHDMVSKIQAVANRQIHKLVQNDDLKKILQKIEDDIHNQLSVIYVSTFRCGPDTMIYPTIAEITKNIPSLFIQSDAMIQELAHLENRVNTHIKQLNQDLGIAAKKFEFEIKIIDEFAVDKLDLETDVLYIPTMNDNRLVLAALRAGGLTVIDNFDESTYNLEKRVHLGRRYCGDTVCSPMASVLADILLAIDDFKKRKEDNDPLVKGKTRVLIFDNKGNGPCRQGQYYEQHKLFLHQKYGHQLDTSNSSNNNLSNNPIIGLIVGNDEKGFNFGIDEWIMFQAYQTFVLQSLLHSVLLEYGAGQNNYQEFERFYKAFSGLKDGLAEHIEKNTRPSKRALKIIKASEKDFGPAAWLIKYIAYGIYNNNGLRKILKDFRKEWAPSSAKTSPVNSAREVNSQKVRVHIEGEIYQRVAQLDLIFYALIDAMGFENLEVSYSPPWSFAELLTEYGQFDAKLDIRKYKSMLAHTDNEIKKNELEKKIKKAKRMIKLCKTLKTVLRKILVKPLYKAAGIKMPHTMKHILDQARQLIPTLKPHGELPPYTGEAMMAIKDGVDLFFNVAPEGCMVASMGHTMTKPINNFVHNRTTRIEGLFSLHGEVDPQVIQIALLKTLGPEKYYRA